MRCAIDSVARLLKHYKMEQPELLLEMEALICEKGISIYDLISLCKKYELYLEARKGLFLPKRVPCILYYRHKKGGHYNVLLHKTWCKLTIYDATLGTRMINKWWFYLFYSHIYIVCYNE